MNGLTNELRPTTRAAILQIVQRHGATGCCLRDVAVSFWPHRVKELPSLLKGAGSLVGRLTHEGLLERQGRGPNSRLKVTPLGRDVLENGGFLPEPSFEPHDLQPAPYQQPAAYQPQAQQPPFSTQEQQLRRDIAAFAAQLLAVRVAFPWLPPLSAENHWRLESLARGGDGGFGPTR